MKKEFKEDLKTKCIEIISWYEEREFPETKNSVFVKYVLDNCFSEKPKKISEKMENYIMAIYNAGPPAVKNQDVVAKIEDAIRTDHGSPRQNEILESILSQAKSGKSLSEKQIALASKIAEEVLESSRQGFWILNEEEKKNIETFLKLSKRYSNYYLTGHGHYLGSNLSCIERNVLPKMISGEKIPFKYKKSYEIVLHKMKTHMKDINNPKFKSGDAVFHGNGQRIGLIISGPVIDKDGAIVYEVMEDLKTLFVEQSTIKTRAKFGKE